MKALSFIFHSGVRAATFIALVLGCIAAPFAVSLGGNVYALIICTLIPYCSLIAMWLGYECIRRKLICDAIARAEELLLNETYFHGRPWVGNIQAMVAWFHNKGLATVWRDYYATTMHDRTTDAHHGIRVFLSHDDAQFPERAVFHIKAKAPEQ